VSTGESRSDHHTFPAASLNCSEAAGNVTSLCDPTTHIPCCLLNSKDGLRSTNKEKGQIKIERTRARSLSHTHPLSRSLARSLTHIHTHTTQHAHTRTHTTGSYRWCAWKQNYGQGSSRCRASPRPPSSAASLASSARASQTGGPQR
jgi:hypothetical protein